MSTSTSTCYAQIAARKYKAGLKVGIPKFIVESCFWQLVLFRVLIRPVYCLYSAYFFLCRRRMRSSVRCPLIISAPVLAKKGSHCIRCIGSVHEIECGARPPPLSSLAIAVQDCVSIISGSAVSTMPNGPVATGKCAHTMDTLGFHIWQLSG